MLLCNFLSRKSLAASWCQKLQVLILQFINGRIGFTNPRRTWGIKCGDTLSHQLGKQHVGSSSMLFMIIPNWQRLGQSWTWRPIPQHSMQSATGTETLSSAGTQSPNTFPLQIWQGTGQRKPKLAIQIKCLVQGKGHTDSSTQQEARVAKCLMS
jgi:hypothetical protein